MNNFQKKYQEKYRSWPDIYTVTSYDGVNMLAKIISVYGNSSSLIQKGLRKGVTYTGVFGDLKFENVQCVKKPLIWKAVKNGEYVF